MAPLMRGLPVSNLLKLCLIFPGIALPSHRALPAKKSQPFTSYVLPGLCENFRLRRFQGPKDPIDDVFLAREQLIRPACM